MASVQLWVGHVYVGTANYNSIAHFLPQLADQALYDGLDIRNLASAIRQPSEDRISFNSTLKVLRTFFGHFKNNRALENFVSRIYITFDHLLHSDLWSPRHSNHKGLLATRIHFVTLAKLSALTSSWMLGHILLRIFWERRRDIVYSERSAHLAEWAIAIGSLSNVVAPEDVDKCLHYLIQRRGDIDYGHSSGRHDHRLDDILARLNQLEFYATPRFGRGRSRNRLRWPPAMRTRSMDPRFHRPMHRLMSPHPNYLPLPAPSPMAIGYPSPAHSMSYSPDGYQDAEIDEMRFEQDLLNKKVANLEANQAELGMAVVEAVSPMGQIGWN